MILRVALDLPIHRLFDYLPPTAGSPRRGQRVVVPFGQQEKVGILFEIVDKSDFPEQLKPVINLLDDLVLPEEWLRLCQFASHYYQAALGQTLLQVLPSGLKRIHPIQRRQARQGKKLPADSGPLPLNPEQSQAVHAVAASWNRFAPFLLYGVTGSGKTEVYLHLMAKALAEGQQALILVPEINLTPQLEARVKQRFPEARIVSLHSELAEASRLRNFVLAWEGGADIVLGTRLALFTPLPRLGLIVLDEEHDPSFKQQDGVRYSARDLAVFRAADSNIPIVLGSATPSLESWNNADAGRYQRLVIRQRAVSQARLPAVKMIDTRKQKLDEGLSKPLLEALQACLERKEQSLIFLNRRGYAPVLSCSACGWASGCSRCAARMVVHMTDQRLRCHHCGLEQRLPRSCPDCGDQDIHAFGRGTQRIEARLNDLFPTARILRVDRDSTRSRKQWESLLEAIDAGEADILVGTQMLAKGHDFPRLSLVGIVGADAGLFAADWRAGERIFSQLSQVAGRAGRASRPGEVLIQTEHPDHPVYQAVLRHDYPGFAAEELTNRRNAGFPPYSFQAILRAEAKKLEDAMAFLNQAKNWEGLASFRKVSLLDAVPMRLYRRANQERGQLLAESSSRPELQRFLSAWRNYIETLPAPGRLRWHIEVDPVDV